MRGGSPDGVAPQRIDTGDEVRRPVVTLEERAAIERLRNLRREPTPRVGAHVGEIPMPTRIVHTNVPGAIARAHPQPGELGEDAVSHERTDPDGFVAGAGDGVSNA